VLLVITPGAEGQSRNWPSALSATPLPLALAVRDELLVLVELIRHEREHTGTPTFELPEGATDDLVEEARTIAAELRANEKAYLVLPNGVKFKWSTTETTTDINATIQRLNQDIAHNVGAGFLLHGSTNTSGSYALASTQAGHYEIGLEKHARFIAGTWNNGQDGWSPIERIVRLNYGERASVPRLVARNLPTRDWAKILPVAHNLIMSGGLRVDEPLRQTIREAMFFPPEDAETMQAVPAQGAQVALAPSQADSREGTNP